MSRVEVLIDGVPSGRARMAVPREDWTRRLPAGQHASVCGFELMVAPDELPDARRPFHVSAVAQTRDGALYAVPGIQLEPEPAPAYAGNVEPAVRRPVAATPAQNGTRVLAFAHHLGVGGAQRYLVELLARLGERKGFSCTVVAPEDGFHRDGLEESGHEVRIVPGLDRLDAESYEAHQAELAALAAERSYDLVLANVLDSFPGVDLADRVGLPSVWALHESFDLDVWWMQIEGSEGAGSYAAGRSAAALRSATTLVFATEATAALYRPHADPDRFVISPYGLEMDESPAPAGLDRAAERQRLGIPADADVVLCMASVEQRKGRRCWPGRSPRWPRTTPGRYLPWWATRAGTTRGRSTPTWPRAVWSPGADRSHDRRPLRVAQRRRRVRIGLRHRVLPVRRARGDGLRDSRARLPGVRPAGARGGGETGLLCPPSDVGALADCLDRLLSMDGSERGALGRAAERRVRERHDPVEHADRVWELLQRAQEPATSRASTAAAAGVKGSGQLSSGSIHDASANSAPSSTSSE